MKIYSETERFKFDYDLKDGVLFKEGRPLDVQLRPLGEGRYVLLWNNVPYIVNVHKTNEHYHVRVAGDQYQVLVEDERTRRVKELVKAAGGAHGEKVIKAPIPGLIVKTPVREGETVEVGAPLLILEAMKMENVIKAPFNCTVKRLQVKEGQTVEQNSPMLIIKGVEE
ncbi:MAG: acetyl-CoA carboxylase biotin carboxyl carrier protein subunit [Calditrichaeota bacterium]|nr:MAG: acetyl-CoA carboxylase biotin carboxyl carrier protein subunit [Calditrichota bacterium]